MQAVQPGAIRSNVATIFGEASASWFAEASQLFDRLLFAVRQDALILK